jgi:hypothetical protein
MQQRPTLLNSCAMAATAAEARFRIDAPIAPSRAARVVALDDGASAVVRRVAELPWSHARFFTCEGRQPVIDSEGVSSGVELRNLDGSPALLADELDGVDVAVMVATDESAQDPNEAAVSLIAAACAVRGIMTAGLVISAGATLNEAVTALRPHARVLMISSDVDDVVDVLTALRA